MAEAGGELAQRPSSQISPTANGVVSIINPSLNPAVPLTSVKEDGSAKRPRDHRMIHLLLSSLGVTAYQERVPLELLDLAYRHTRSILTESMEFSSDAYVSQQTRAKDAPPGGGFKDTNEQVNMSAVQLAVQSRLQYQFNGGRGGGVSKEFLLDQAEQRNKVALPKFVPNEWGVRLPNERFVLSGVPWGLKEEHESEEMLEEDRDVSMAMDGGDGDEMPEGDEEGGNMDDLFGTDETMEDA